MDDYNRFFCADIFFNQFLCKVRRRSKHSDNDENNVMFILHGFFFNHFTTRKIIKPLRRKELLKVKGTLLRRKDNKKNRIHEG